MQQLLGRTAVLGILAAALFAGSVALTQNASAQGPATIPMSVTENREPGLSGSATMTQVSGNDYRVEIRMSGLPPNDAARPAHIHGAPGAQCDNNAPITYPLSNVTVDGSGNGTSVSTITITADKPIVAGQTYINVHNPAQGGRGVFCGNISTNVSAAGTGGPAPAPGGQAQPGALPRTGVGLQADSEVGGSTFAALAVAALAIVIVGAGATLITRTRA